MIIEVHPEHPHPRRIRRAVDALERGELIAYPTDTVYAVGCSIQDKNAVELIHRIKADKSGSTAKRQRLSIIVPDLSAISEWAVVTDRAYRLLKLATPGAFTFVLPASRKVPRTLLTRQKTIGVRVPDARIPVALTEMLGHPIITTSASNSEGELLLAPHDIQDAYSGRVELVLDAGPLLPEPSTVIDLTGDVPEVIREGKGNLQDIGLVQMKR